MHGVHSRHREVEAEEQLGLAAVRALEVEVRPRHEMVDELLVILEDLHAEKDRPEQDRQRQENDQPAAVADLRGMHRERHRHAAADQHRGIERADDVIEVMARLGERPGELHPIDRVGGEEPTEEQHFGDEEGPHAEPGGLRLLLDALELMLLVRGQRVRFVRQRFAPASRTSTALR